MFDKDKEESTIKFVTIDGVTHIIDTDKQGSAMNYLSKVLDEKEIDEFGE
tara:strand:+ start:3786 stop:3935 length:150 start_codon:yes stop_codon:yes gene_type:complete